MRLRILLLLLPFIVTANVRAHHSFAAEFTADRKTTITGVVSEVWFRNPHVRYYVEVTTDNGSIEHWDTRGGSPALLTRRGWTKDSIRAGDRITLGGYSAKDDGRKLLSIIWIELADGTRLE